VPIHPIFGAVRINSRGYARISKRGPNRNKYLHLAVWEKIAGRPVPDGFEVHHMNGKACVCPRQLVCLPKIMNPAPEPLRCPFTGQFISKRAWEEIYCH
jgi:hypothetical protein